jgi:hypothetical protein
MAVPAHSATALAAAAPAAIIAAGSRTIAAAAVDAATGAPRQPIDQVLLLPALRQCRLRAELLQLRDGLRADRKHRTQRVSHGHEATTKPNGQRRELCATATQIPAACPLYIKAL